MLTIENFSFGLDNKMVHDLSVTCFQSSITEIIGDQKLASLLLRSLAKLLKPYQGKILVAQADSSKTPEEYYNDINYIEDKFGFKANLSVIDNLKLWADIYETEILIPAAMHFFELADIAEVKIIKLTAEQKQTVKLARLIINPVPIWYLDNPFKSLTPAIQKKVENMIEVRAREGGIILLTNDNNKTTIANNQINLVDFMRSKDDL